jgi:bifunctional non-homologous end joining protein LigD
MGLQRYQEKRDFRLTPEPRGRTGRRKAKELSFVVQKHAASHLHYDFRLELDGVLKSWAVPKGPSLDPADKRLAVEVEDHPLDYGTFEGVIPKGQYGGGSVLLWDRGTWEPLADPHRGLERGKLEFSLDGEKLHGRWLLVRTRSDAGKPQWLLRKVADDEARPAADGSIVVERPESVETGRTIEEIGKRPARVWRSDRAEAPKLAPETLAKAKKAALPPFLAPQLATLVAEPPTGEGWVHEIKLDGYRALCRVEGGKATFLTRRGNDWTDTFGRLASAAAYLPTAGALLDGEVVWLGADGKADFQALQGALGEGRDERLAYFAFDLLHLDGHDLTRAPLLERKELLAKLLAAAPAEAKAALRYSDHVAGHGEDFFGQACRLGLEGIIAKRADAPYKSGRGTDWLKVKCLAEQELVIVGWTEPSGSREALGALLVGVHEDGRLRHAGKVGTGFDAATLRDLLARLRPLERATPPVANAPRGYKARGVHWVEPRLVAQVAFTGWTTDGALRHPSFKGLREDKDASEVVKEEPMAVREAAEPAARRRSPARAASAKAERAGAASARAPRAAAKRAGTEPKPRSAAGKAPATMTQARATKANASATAKRKGTGKTAAKPAAIARDGSVEIAGVRVSNPGRVLYPEQGLTKLELVRYYERVADLILPHLAGRPLTLVRCPAGRDKHCFYQKHIAEETPPTLVEVPVVERSGAQAMYVAVESLAGIVSLAQMGVLELHPWGSRKEHIEQPDVLIFDLDPGPGVGWKEVITAAKELRDLLRELQLESFAKLSGGKGVHLVVPIEPEADWEGVKAFTFAVVSTLAQRHPDRYVTTMAKNKRHGKIFLDYLRNGFGNTAVAPYSTRARPGAPVAAPIRWEELVPRLSPDRYTVRNMAKRLSSLAGDPWEGYFDLRQRLPAGVLRELTKAKG